MREGMQAETAMLRGEVAAQANGAQAADVRLVNVSKRFGDVWALRPTSLDVFHGEFFSLLGASGSGKTTTLRIIGGFEEPTSGEVFLRGREMSRMAPYERPVNTVFQDYALFPHMTVAENVGYGLRVKRVNKKVIARRVADALDLIRLSGFDKRKPAQLSGGQRQRVALARALVNSPAVLLLDEPLGALDLKLRREMQAELKRIQRDVGITFLYVTHDQDEAMSMSDRIAVMRDGMIEQIGAPSEVYERPVNAFVAGFVGISNVIEATVAGREGDLTRVDSPEVGPIRIPGQPDSIAGKILISVRPEKVTMLPLVMDRPSRENVLRGRVTEVLYGGAFTRYEVAVGEQRLIVMEQNTGAGPRVREGEEVWLGWSAEQTVVFPGSRDDLVAGTQAAVTSVS
jgi:spermidine/putrescine transport system ATP-binding protein